MMIKLILRLVINTASIWVAAYFIDGITLDTKNLVGVAIVALVFGFANAVIKPIVKFFSFPAIVLTLGLFTVLINAALLWGTAALTSALTVQGVMPAIIGSIIIGLVSWVLSLFLDDDDDE